MFLGGRSGGGVCGGCRKFRKDSSWNFLYSSWNFLYSSWNFLYSSWNFLHGSWNSKAAGSPDRSDDQLQSGDHLLQQDVWREASLLGVLQGTSIWWDKHNVTTGHISW